MTDEFQAMWAEIQDARMAEPHPTLHQVRVTPLALCGSIAIVPMSPERIRAAGLDPFKRPKEALVHPEDWRSMLKVIPGGADHPIDPTATRVFGIPVVRES